jgi:predicted CXXCH cytochrome family protein
MIRPTMHLPFAERNCDACHADAKASVVSPGGSAADLCATCHDPRQAGHPVPKGASCTSCHTPHASSAPSLIAGPEKEICLACHKEIASRRAGSIAFHPASGVAQDCTVCHELHTGKTRALLKQQDPLATCTSCHGSHSQFSHPMGEGVQDPSHPGQPLACLSCHDPHGTSFPQFLLADPRQDLCRRCHQESGQ